MYNILEVAGVNRSAHWFCCDDFFCCVCLCFFSIIQIAEGKFVAAGGSCYTTPGDSGSPACVDTHKLMSTLNNVLLNKLS